MNVLETKNLAVSFGGLTAVQHFDLSLRKGELVGLIGPNGAGKTTVFNLITGVYKPTEGEIRFTADGKETSIGGMRTHQIARMGISRTFQNIRLFRNLSALDNVLLPMHHTSPYHFLQAVFRTNQFLRGEEEMKARAHELLRVVHLDDKCEEMAGNLAYGEQRRLEIARALALGQNLILLDEPAAGMNTVETQELSDLIFSIRDQFHLTVLLIEHDMGLVMRICERIVVLDHGEIIAVGPPDEIKNNERVIKAYLGEEANAHVED